MALRTFKHAVATSVEHASALTTTGSERAAIVAGGTDLLGGLKDNIHPRDAYPELLVDIKRVEALKGIAVERKALRIGALATLREVATHPAVRERWGALAEAARAVASPQIRNVATIGGNVCQEPRCWYYRNPENAFHCLRKGGERCNAMFGENRFHSIFGSVRVAGSPCSQGCPAHVEIPRYMAQLRAGDWRAAAAIVLERNPMPAVTGRVCPHYCQQGCTRHDQDEAVSVRAIERALGDYALEHAKQLYAAPKASSGKKVAVVGAGPAGLAAAHALRRRGHAVTVFDAMPEAGGMLRYSLPAYRMPREVVRRQVEAFEGMGITFETGAAVGSGKRSLKALRRQFDGVLLTTGLWRQKTLGIEREDLLTAGLDFLIGVRKGEVTSVERRVLVIGGGNVAVDVAISALRLGAAEVTMACLERRDEMPAFPEDIEQALLEKVTILPSWGPRKVLSKRGALTGMSLVRCTRVFDGAGRFAPEFDAKETTTVEADQVIVAIGQAADLGYASAGAVATARNLIVIEPETGATSLRGVYAAGDATSGPASVVEAIAGGRRAAAAIDAFLGGEAAVEPDEAGAVLAPVNVAALERSAAATTPEREVSKRTIDGEDKATIDLDAVAREVQRCAHCGCVAVNASDVAPALVALDATIVTNRRAIPAARFFAARTLRSTVLEAGELVEAIEVPAPRPGTRQAFVKFRTRASIDFPILSVATVLHMKADKVAQSRIVLGAVAPVPVRAAAAEAALKGQEPKAAAATAGKAATEAARPLARNGYKVPIVAALVAKSIVEAV